MDNSLTNTAGKLDGPLHNSLLRHLEKYHITTKGAEDASRIREDKEESGEKSSRLECGEEERSSSKDLE